MDSKLARELKEAGFPHTWCSEDDCSCLTNGENSPCFPSFPKIVEEILKLAPEPFYFKLSYRSVVGEGRKKLWRAVLARIREEKIGYGATIETAAGNLWLEVKKKDCF